MTQEDWDVLIGIMNVIALEFCRREHTIGFGKQVAYLFSAGARCRRIALVADIGRSNQVLPVPWNDKKGSFVLCRFDVKGAFRRAIECIDNDVAALRAAHEGFHFAVDRRQHTINPRSCRI